MEGKFGMRFSGILNSVFENCKMYLHAIIDMKTNPIQFNKNLFEHLLGTMTLSKNKRNGK